MKKAITAVFAATLAFGTMYAGDNDGNRQYSNPIIRQSVPDPTVIKAKDGKKRQVFLSQVKWKGGWPYIDGGTVARRATAPYFKTK